MPLPFRIGLIATVLVLAAVRGRKSLRFVLRSLQTDAAKTFAWSRWRHLAMVWALLFFCVPFVAAVAFPDRARTLSAGIDEWFAHASSDHPASTPAADGGTASLTADDLMKLEISHQTRSGEAAAAYAAARRRRDQDLVSGLAMFGIAGVFVVVLIGVSSLLARLRKAGAMAAAALVGLFVSVAAFAFTGVVATRAAGVPSERAAVSEYAAAKLTRAQDAAWLAGPSRVVGRPSEVVGGRDGYLFFLTPEEDAAGDIPPWTGFTLGPLTVGPAAKGELYVLQPSVKLGPDGREIVIRADEDVVVMGFVENQRIVPKPGYPIAVAPATAHRALDRLSERLFGSPTRRSLYTALLQVAAGAAAAWFLSLFLAAVCEGILGRFPQAPVGAHPLDITSKHPTITQFLRSGNS